MADFRKWIYALAVVALLAGFTVPVSAQSPPFQCTANAGVPPIVRAEGYTELVGDLTLNCTGGVSTPAGATVPQVNITILLSTNITSRLLAGGLFNEALLIIDEPHSAVNPARDILNCGASGAPDTGTSGPGVCSIISTGNPANTYDGTKNADGGGVNSCDGIDPDGTGPIRARLASGSFGCGRPNVFQGRIGIAQNTGQNNSTVFLGVPLDPPGTTTNRTIRITNVRSDAEFTGVSSTFQTAQIQMNIAVNGNTSLSINNPQQIVAYVQKGLVAQVQTSKLDFIQCIPENGALFNGVGGSISTYFNSPQPSYRFQEGFASSFKVRNFSEILANGTFTAGATYYAYNGGTSSGSPDINQNVPGAIYNTEGGFSFRASTVATEPTINPPAGVGTIPVSSTLNPLSSTSTGIAGAGVATQGTRLVLSFSSLPSGSAVYVPAVVNLVRQGTSTPATGVAVYTATDATGSGAYTPPTSLSNLVAVGSSNLAVYEVLFADPFSLEQVDIPIVVAYVANLAQNLPQPGVTGQVAGGFAPFSASATWRQPSSTLPIPRFIPGTVPQNLYLISKCACNLLFPYVVSSAGFDTGIALANASQDPGAAFGFLATPQNGTVTFFYYGSGANNSAAPPPQTTNKNVNAGTVLTYVASSGNADFGLDNRAAGFVGYVITQSQFQYCHAFAYISALGAGPLTPGTSEGYLGIVLDKPNTLPRTVQLAGENDGH